jgi:hypothetical protein
MILNREEAKLFLAIKDMEALEPSKREAVIIDMLDGDIPNFEDPNNAKYNQLVIEWIVENYKGVTTKFLESEISSILSTNISVSGEEEGLDCCPCCNYKTLEERGQYTICRVCFWEDDGSDDESKYSSVNRMYLKEAKENFLKDGFINQSAKKFVDSRGKDKFVFCGSVS